MEIGENSLPDRILERHGLKSFTTPYSRSKSNIDYAITLEKSNYVDLLTPGMLYYSYSDESDSSKKTVRSKIITDCDDIFSDAHQKGFEFSKDVIKNKKHYQTVKSAINRLIKLRKSLSKVCFLYYYENSPNMNLETLFYKVNNFLEFYNVNPKKRAFAVVFTQKIVGDKSERTVIQKPVNDNLCFFEFHTTKEWKGKNPDQHYALIDDDLIKKMIDEMKLKF